MRYQTEPRNGIIFPWKTAKKVARLRGRERWKFREFQEKMSRKKKKTCHVSWFFFDAVLGCSKFSVIDLIPWLGPGLTPTKISGGVGIPASCSCSRFIGGCFLKWWYPQPKMIMFSRKTHWLLGKPTILGTPQVMSPQYTAVMMFWFTFRSVSCPQEHRRCIVMFKHQLPFFCVYQGCCSNFGSVLREMMSKVTLWLSYQPSDPKHSS